MKIFFCDNRLGGLLGFRSDIIKHFVDQGHDVCLVVPPALTEWDKIGVQNLEGIRIITINMQPSGFNVFKDFLLFLQYLKIFKKERPDIIFNYTIKPNIYSSLAASCVHCRVICMLAGLGYMFSGEGLIKKLGLRLYRYGLSKAEKVLVLNQMNYDKLLDTNMVPKSKLIWLRGGEGIDLRHYAPSPADYSHDVTFLMVARILKDKGYHEYVKAAKEIKFQCFSSYFELMGPLAYDSPMGVTQECFEADQKAGIFHYLGVSNDVISALERPNIVIVLPSYSEGLNHSLMEACAIGRPIITTDIAGCRETVEDGKNGFLVPPNDANALVEAIKRFLHLSNEEKIAFAHHSRALAEERFDIKNVIEVYDRLITGSTPHNR